MAIKKYKKGAKTKLSANFNQSEFDCKGNGCCSETLIDESLVKSLQKIRNHFGKPITINSGFRCAKHNKNVGGASGSRHTKGQAADIVIKGVAPLEVAKYAEHMNMKGIGLYSNFVHVDTRQQKSFWKNHTQEYTVTFGGKNPYTPPNANVKRGKKGITVKWCQWELKFAGYNCGKIDGIAGEKFVNAVKEFQKDNDLFVDGVVGKATRTAMRGI